MENHHHHHYFPVGAFIVNGSENINKIIKILRDKKRLKKGKNVTEFNTNFCKIINNNNNENNNNNKEIKEKFLYTFENENEILFNNNNNMNWNEISINDDHILPMFYFEANENKNNENNNFFLDFSALFSHKKCFAIHVNGYWENNNEKNELLFSILNLKNNNENNCVLCFIKGLRVYSPCCTPILENNNNNNNNNNKMIKDLIQKRNEMEEYYQNNENNNNFYFSELFSGIGMFREGIERFHQKNENNKNKNENENYKKGVSVFAVECAAPAVAVYEKNFPNENENHHSILLKTDISEIPSYYFPRHDLLTAGFPCQSFSKAHFMNQNQNQNENNNNINHHLGLESSKGQLFYEVIRVLRQTTPSYFLLENVSFLSELNDGKEMEHILETLRAPFLSNHKNKNENENENHNFNKNNNNYINYSVYCRVMDNRVVSPQVRRRTYFVGILNNNNKNENENENFISTIFDRAEQNMQHWKNNNNNNAFACVGDLLLNEKPHFLMNNHNNNNKIKDYLSSFQLSSVQCINLLRLKKFRDHPSWRVSDLCGCARTLMSSYRISYQLYSEFVPYFPSFSENNENRKEAIMKKALEEVQQKIALFASTFHENENNNNENDNSFLLPLRFYTPRECARLQGIRDDFSLLLSEEHNNPNSENNNHNNYDLSTGTVYKLVNNAVNPIVIGALCEALFSLL